MVHFSSYEKHKKFMIKLFWSRMLQWVQMMITVCHIGSIWAFTAKIKELATAISSQESIFPDELRLKSGKIVKALKSRISNMKTMFQIGEYFVLIIRGSLAGSNNMEPTKMEFTTNTWVKLAQYCSTGGKLHFAWVHFGWFHFGWSS